jgi:hypothetical protein
MKQLSFYFLIALCCISIHAKAQSCALDQVGTTTVSPTSTLADMAIDGNNKVYSLAYNGTTTVIELKSATVSSSWTLVATVPTVTNTTVKPALAINKIGEIIAFIRDEPNGKVGKVYKSTGGAFTQIGGAISVGPVSDLSIAFSATNELYIAYTDVTPSNLATVKRWNGSAWLYLSTPQTTEIGAWQTWTPTIAQGATLTKTVGYAKYTQINKLVIAHMICTITSAGTGGSTFSCSLPIAAASADVPYFGSNGTATFYANIKIQIFTISATCNQQAYSTSSEQVKRRQQFTYSKSFLKGNVNKQRLLYALLH